MDKHNTPLIIKTGDVVFVKHPTYHNAVGKVIVIDKYGSIGVDMTEESLQGRIGMNLHGLIKTNTGSFFNTSDLIKLLPVSEICKLKFS